MTKILSCAVVVGLLVASSSSVFAKGPGGNNGGTNASAVAPGHQSGTAPVSGRPGASGWAPGQQMINHVTPATGVTAPGNGASVYAPGFLK
jgi:hypothetical protein